MVEMWNNCLYEGGFWYPPFFIIIIIVLLLYSIFSKNRLTHIVSSRSSALESLNLRYAKGEIDKDEYEHIKQDLL